MENSLFPDIRLRKVIMTNFRNIEHAEVDFPNGKLSEFKEGKSSVLGVYGQNGSGKTSLIMAVNALQRALTGGKFVENYWPSCIRAGCKFARLEFELSGYSAHGEDYDIYYGFSMSVGEIEDDDADPLHMYNDVAEMFGYGKMFSKEGVKAAASFTMLTDAKMIIFDEKLQYAWTSKDGKKLNKQVLIDTSDQACKDSGKAFGNKTKYEQFTTNNDSNIDEYLNVEKIKASIGSRSFIFSRKVRNALYEGSVKASYKILLKSLFIYGALYLIVVMMDSVALTNINLLPLTVWFTDADGAQLIQQVPINLNGRSKLPEEIYGDVKRTIESISNIIKTIVPGLTLEIYDSGKTISETGMELHIFSVVSNRGGVKIPLAYESAGIRRMISFLMTFVAAYNNPSVTVAIDEIDSGIYEYMLGELLSILNESAQGQLVFTSHDLRLLEVLPYKNHLFTTVNPENRFSRLEGISGNNNLRDSYFRCITLGTGKDAYYSATDRFNIEQAIFEAGLPVEE